MAYKKPMTHGLFGLGLALTFMSAVGCGEDPQTYENESIVFENISKSDAVAAKTDEELDRELSLKEEEGSNFGSARPLLGYGNGYGYGSAYGYAPFPVFPYYQRPIVIRAPIGPFAPIVDIVHPFYFAPYLGNLLDDDDDDGHPFDW